MPTLERAAVPTWVPEATRRLTTAVAVGLVLGIGDLLWMTHAPWPWAGLANSSAVWAIAAFVLGAVLRLDAVPSAVLGVVMLTIAVESYYAAAVLLLHDDVATLWSPVAETWLVFGVFAGVIFGAAGSCAVGADAARASFGVAVGAAVLLGEALHTLVHLDHTIGSFHADLAQTASATAGLGFLVLAASLRRPLVTAGAAVACLPLAVFCAAAFSVVGIAY